MAFGDLLNKAKDKTQEVSSSVKEKVENTKDSLGNLSKVVEEMINNLNEALPILKKYGFGLIELEIELGVPPKLVTHFDMSNEDFTEELRDKIATEKDVSNTEELAKFLKEKKHPVMMEGVEEEEENEGILEKVETETVKSISSDSEGVEIGDVVAELVKDRGIQIIMKNVKIVINLNVKK